MPVIRKIFPQEKNSEVLSIMCMSMAANAFGVGNTPFYTIVVYFGAISVKKAGIP